MSVPKGDSGPTSNDLLHELVAKHAHAEVNYQIVAQSAEDVENIENAPAVSIGPYLLRSGQIQLLTTISIYSLRGDSREQMRLLYMNAAAVRVWQEMGTRAQDCRCAIPAASHSSSGVWCPFQQVVGFPDICGTAPPTEH